MVARTNHRTTISRTTLIAILVALTAALVARSVLQVQLLKDGLQPFLAADVSYLVVPVVLVGLLFPLWRTERPFLAAQFQLSDLNWRLVSRALAIGLLIRIIWWCQLVAGTSFGVYQSTESTTVVGPIFSFQCATPAVVALGVLVMGMLTPAIEETVNRGYVLNALRRRGFLVSVIVSALVFTVFHKLSSWPFTMFAGLVLGMQYWSTASLWSSLISHSAVNSLILIDWRCLTGLWNPRNEDLPILQPGLIAIGMGVICLGVLLIILRDMATGARVPR
jgi:membrane protease YdiL (CAAX protease family)